MHYEQHDNDAELDFFAEFSDVKPLKQETIDYVPSVKDSLAKQFKRQNIEQSLQLANNYLSMECGELVEPYDQLSYKYAVLHARFFITELVIRLNQFTVFHAQVVVG